MIDGKNFFDQPVKNDKVTYENIRKTTIGQGDDYTTGCLLDYNYFEKYKIITVDLSKQQVLDADPRNCKSFMNVILLIANLSFINIKMT